MKIGLPFLTQLQGSAESESGQAGTSDSVESGGRQLGGWMAQTIRQLVAQVATGYHTQHNDDDTHKVITASGSITERGRSTAMGVWINVPFNAGYFTAPSGSTWTVTASEVVALQYTLVGTTMHVSFYIESSTLATAACAVLYIALPANVKATRRISNQFAYDDNGTKGTGIVQVRPTSAITTSGTTLELMKDMRGSTNWSTSATLSMIGEIAFEIVAADVATPPNSTFVASGGTITNVGSQTIHTFTASGNFTVLQGTAAVQYLAVGAGGGGGGSGGGVRGGGGGGAGEYVVGSVTLIPGVYTVTVGAKGTGGGNSTNGTAGTDSSVAGTSLNKTAKGGGLGTGTFVSAGNGGAGGSGGGAGDQAAGASGGASTASDGTGHAGGADAGITAGGSGGSGGGATGAGAVGVAGSVGQTTGGAGTANTISGSSVTYCRGGNGGANNADANGTAGVNPGDGGYGTSVLTTNNNGGNGHDGIVIFSYTTP